jgi:hypothetical protein
VRTKQKERDAFALFLSKVQRHLFLSKLMKKMMINMVFVLEATRITVSGVQRIICYQKSLDKAMM